MKMQGSVEWWRELGASTVAVPVELRDMACGLPVCEELRMLVGVTRDVNMLVVLAAVKTAAESDVQPSSASILAMDCSILASVNSPGSAGCMSANGDESVSVSWAAAGKAAGSTTLLITAPSAR